MANASIAPLGAPTRTLQELVMAAHFQVPLPLTVLDLADWVSLFSDFPIVQQLDHLGPLNLPGVGPVPQFALQFAQPGLLPRMLLRSPDGRYTVQLQDDRFGFSWTRIEPLGETANYPGFEAMLERWLDTLSRFEAWTEQRFHLRPAHRLVEINYANADPLDRDGKTRRISEIFKFVQPSRGVNAFNTSWSETVYPIDPDQPRFRGVVNAVAALTEIPPARVLAFNFTGFAEVADGQQSKHIMNDIHAKIREMYESAIVSDVH